MTIGKPVFSSFAELANKMWCNFEHRKKYVQHCGHFYTIAQGQEDGYARVLDFISFCPQARQTNERNGEAEAKVCEVSLGLPLPTCKL